MREKIAQQAPLMPAPIAHKHARELQQMSEVLGQLPEVTELVHADLVRGTQTQQGTQRVAGRAGSSCSAHQANEWLELRGVVVSPG